MAVINIGSGSVKLYLASTKKTEGRVTLFAGNNSKATEETFSAVAYFFCKARTAGETVAIFGTEAMRRSDGLLKSRIEQELGVSVEIIDGQTEALCGFLGAENGRARLAANHDLDGTLIRTLNDRLNNHQSNNLAIGDNPTKSLDKRPVNNNLAGASSTETFGGQRRVVVDVGGASTELSCGVDFPDFCCSLPMGSVALHNIFGEKETRDSAFLPEVFSYVNSLLSTVNYGFGADNAVILIGGSGKYLARLFAVRNPHSADFTNKSSCTSNNADLTITAMPANMHNNSTTTYFTNSTNISANMHTDKCADAIITEKIPDIIKELFSLSPAQRTKRYPFIEEKRALVIPYGLCIIYRVLDFLHCPAASTSTSGLIEGYIKLRGL